MERYNPFIMHQRYEAIFTFRCPLRNHCQDACLCFWAWGQSTAAAARYSECFSQCVDALFQKFASTQQSARSSPGPCCTANFAAARHASVRSRVASDAARRWLPVTILTAADVAVRGRGVALNFPPPWAECLSSVFRFAQLFSRGGCSGRASRLGVFLCCAVQCRNGI